MTDSDKAGRVALVAAGDHAAALRKAFRSAALQAWDPFVAEGCEHAHFLVQMDACDVVVVDQSALDPASAGSLGWLTGRPEIPVLFLSENVPELILHALAHGVRQWLPRPLALDHPAMLAAGLQHAVLGRAGAQRSGCGEEQLRACRNQVTRLVNLLWDATPAEDRPRWFSQRYMLERLHEEVCRSQRHGGSLALVLGEVRGEEDGPAGAVPDQVSQWMAERVHQSKRRCDVAGQYGLRGFMLLLPHTPPEGAARYCQRLTGLLEGSSPLTAAGLWSCFGVASYSPAMASPKSLLRRAEEQLDEARSARLAEL